VRWSALCVVFLLGCETDEVRAWKTRRAALETRQAELMQLESTGRKSNVETFRRAIDLPGFLRERKLAARAFVEPTFVRLAFNGTVQECRDLVNAVEEVRWLTDTWRLRLEKGRCDWEARTGEDYVTLEKALIAPPAKWVAPPSQILSAGVTELKAVVTTLEKDVSAREVRLGDLAVLQGSLDAVQPLVDALHARPAPCDLAVLDRELALDAAEQGALLEVERTRLVHPLEPRGDFRLRGLVDFQDGIATWHCDAL
jgi:hypothetical protein